MSLTLYPPQADVHAAAKAALARGKRSILIQASTGFGKTVLAAKMLKNAKDRGYRALFVVHRKELVEQSVLTLTQAAEISVGIVAAGFQANRSEPIQVCMVQTLAKRLHIMPKPHLIIFDEAHHLVAGSWWKIKDAFPDAVVVGLTATPERLDGRGLGECFDELVCGPSTEWLIENGYLSPYKLYAPNMPDLSAVHTTAGDFNKKEVAIAMQVADVVGDALTHYKKYAMGLRGIGFAWSVESSIAIAEQFNAAGIPAAHIDGNTDARLRDRIVTAFRDGAIRTLWNVEIVTEGFDCPEAECAFLLRPTQSLALYLQMVGRVLRPKPGKTALIFDHTGNCRTHGLPDDERIWSLDSKKRKRNSDSTCPVKQCPKCYAVITAASMTCKYCGFVFQIAAREVSHQEGDLAEVDVIAQRAQRKAEEKSCRTLDAMIALGIKRGYANADRWARHMLHYRHEKHEAFRNAGRLKAAGEVHVAEEMEMAEEAL